MNARYYDSNTNRMLSPDSIVPNSTNPQSFNRYSYVYNNPLRYTDPSGHLTEDEMEKYFGYSGNQDDITNAMLENNWQLDVIEWLLHGDTNFGDVFGYDDGMAMLVLFETSVDSGQYYGGFYGLDNDNRGKQVNYSSLTGFNGFVGEELEATYRNEWHTLPIAEGTNGTPYYIPTMYINLNTFDIPVKAIGAGATIGGGICLLAPGCKEGIATAITIIGVTALTVDFLRPDDPLSVSYPVIMLPQVNVIDQVEYENLVHRHISAPTGSSEE